MATFNVSRPGRLLLLTQLLPLFVFIVVDSIVTDVRLSILSAIAFAAGQLVFTYVKRRLFDWFILVDVGLIVALGGVSILFKNELFFKLKPAIIEGVTIVFFLALVLAPRRVLLGYVGRMMPTMVQRPEALGMMRSMFGWMCALVALHIGAVLYAAFYSTKTVWAMVSGPGFYAVFLPFLGVAAVRVARSRRAARRRCPEP